MAQKETKAEKGAKKLLFEITDPKRITLESFRGVFDKALASDCRCGHRTCRGCEFTNFCAGAGSTIRPWTALSSSANYRGDVLTPAGLVEGDMPNRKQRTPLKDLSACNIFGQPHELGYNQVEESIIEFLDGDGDKEEKEEIYFNPSDLLAQFTLMELEWRMKNKPQPENLIQL